MPWTAFLPPTRESGPVPSSRPPSGRITERTRKPPSCRRTWIGRGRPSSCSCLCSFLAYLASLEAGHRVPEPVAGYGAGGCIDHPVGVHAIVGILEDVGVQLGNFII